MGKIKKRESIGLEDVLPEDLGKKLVTSVIDKEGAKRLKTLARRYTKHAIASYQEKELALSLLQIACVIGNVQAGMYTHISQSYFSCVAIPIPIPLGLWCFLIVPIIPNHHCPDCSVKVLLQLNLS